MDIQPTTTQPISDDQELAKVLAGVSQQADDTLQFEETPLVPVVPPAPAIDEGPVIPVSELEITLPAAADDLEGIKKDALIELRPLVDKLDLAPEEKFDTYLLLLRSTDDKTLIAPAHTAAQGIPDETRRAQALLDIIKEIDYLSAAK
jgi:hypothetical protein